MLTKITGVGTVLAMSATTQTFTATTFLYGDISLAYGNLPPLKVRIATNSQPAYVAFGTKTVNTLTAVLIPSNYCEHFKLDSTSTVSVLQAGTGGLISITPVA
jgi:hypothetical protein